MSYPYISLIEICLKLCNEYIMDFIYQKLLIKRLVVLLQNTPGPALFLSLGSSLSARTDIHLFL